MKNPISEFRRLLKTPQSSLTVSDSWKLVGGYLIIGSVASGAVSLTVHGAEKAQERFTDLRYKRADKKLAKMHAEHEELMKNVES